MEHHLRKSLALVSVITVCLQSYVAAAGYTNVYNSAAFSWLDQFNIQPPDVGSNACVPTSAINALGYLQNSYSTQFGTNLIGTGYANWLANGQTMASSPYMDTTPTGTLFNHIPFALNKYVKLDKGFNDMTFSGMFNDSVWDLAPYNKPSYITSGMPTTSFLTNALSQNGAIIMSLIYTNGGGHEVTVSGLNWNDANENNIMDNGEAKLSFVDPLDPSASYSGTNPLGAAKFTQGDIWWNTNKNELQFTYDQYGGSLPWENTYGTVSDTYINTMFVMTVPEPSTSALFALAGLGFIGLA